ncbi:hypothetical protein A5788_22215 [Gordonia sp. 852002-50816_SCH5313054-c]|nr:hypothetical protein A5788_22215 [Gordonia sp. 852002-50816_SCH5313054-c]OBC17580.1 hypothetical protein A5786_18835 [Gordonia sp. 852002-50816_SCH5313054-a]
MTCNRWADDDGLDCYLECRDHQVRTEFDCAADRLMSIPPSKPLPSSRSVWLAIFGGCIVVDALVVLGVVSIVEWLGAR